MIVCFWMITEGTGKILYHGGFDNFYDGQLASLQHGHWDVSPDAIRGEGFLYHGKYFGYFGFTPVLPRILLNWLFPSYSGQWSRLLMLLWVALVIAAIVAFIDELEIPPNPFLLVVAVLGSTLIFVCSHAIVYHEAIITGGALALWAYFFFCRYLRRPGLLSLTAACLLSFVSFFARLTVGAGPLMVASFFCVALLFRRFVKGRGEQFLDWLELPSPDGATTHATILALCLGITSAAYLSINHAKFGTWLNPAPYQYHVQYDAARLARIEGSINHFSNIPFDSSAYFGIHRIGFLKSFPWLSLVNNHPDPGSAAKMDLVEGYSSVTAAMPGLAILSILGAVFAVNGYSRYRAMLPILAASFAAGCLILTNAYVTYRYLHDFYPFLVISSILGVGAMRSIPSKSLRSSVTILIVLAGIWSIAANMAFTLKWQREDFWPDPVPKAEFQRLRHRIDLLLPFGNLETIRYKIGDELDLARAGQLLHVLDPPSTYRYDGRRWNYVDGTPMHRFHLLVKFPQAGPNTHMALWFAGHFGSSDAIFLVYSNPTQVSFCADHWGTGVLCGPTMDIQPDHEYRLQIDADRLNSLLTVELDGRKVLEDPMQFHVWTNQDILFGKSLAPDAHGAPFTGEIRQEEPK